MKLEANNINNNLTFKALKPSDATNFVKLKEHINLSLNGFHDELFNSIAEQAPCAVKKIDGIEYIADFNVTQKVFNAVKSFVLMPFDGIDNLIKKFPKSKLNNSDFIKKYRKSVRLENQINAYQGTLENGAKFVKELINEGFNPSEIERKNTKIYNKFSNGLRDKFNKLLNKQMSYGVADYDTKKERFITRIISGFTAAFFLGNDFYNKSIQKGKTKEEAKKEQLLKQGQEIKENVCEGLAQFALLACFSKIVNKSVWAPAILSTLIALVSRIISRKSSGMPLGRIKTIENNTNVVSINDFIAKAKLNKAGEDGKLSNENNDEKTNKKPILSIKNILLFCAFSVIGGYALRFGKNHTKIGKEISGLIKNRQRKFNAKTIEKVIASRSDLKNISAAALEVGEINLANKIDKILSTHLDSNKFVLGTDYKITKVLGIDLNTRELLSLPTAPLRFIKEIISYPYKIVTKLENAIRNSGLKAKGIEPPSKPELLKDPENIKNLYKRFLDFKKKFPDNPAKLRQEFGKYIKEMRILSNNSVTSSSTDNSKIAVLAQTLGTLTGMWFNMNDEYNSSIRNGASKSEAQKDARLRGINKFFRMTVQVIISGSLNSLFFKQYNNSLVKAGAVVALSTILTDMASRLLSGMPNKKMTKEELEKYQKEHKEGPMAWYYKMIDKLAS